MPRDDKGLVIKSEEEIEEEPTPGTSQGGETKLMTVTVSSVDNLNVHDVFGRDILVAVFWNPMWHLFLSCFFKTNFLFIEPQWCSGAGLWLAVMRTLV